MKKLLKKLLAPLIREVVNEIIRERVKKSKALGQVDIWSDNINGCLRKD